MSHPDTTCPHCGAEVSLNASGCRECGAMKQDGQWTDPEIYDGLDLPGDDDFDYDDFVASEFGEGKAKASPAQVLWWFAALVTLLAFAWLSLVTWW